MHFFGRSTELKWMKRTIKLDSQMCVYGPSGVGKSLLIFHFLRQNGYKFISKDYSELNGIDEKIMESYSVIHWNCDAHFPDGQSVLNKFPNHFHIFECQRNVSRLGMPTLYIEPLSKKEALIYLTEVDGDLSNEEKHLLYQKSGGNFKYIKKLILEELNSIEVDETKAVSPSAKRIFKYCALLNRPVTRDELEQLNSTWESDLHEVKERFLLRVVEEDSYQVTSFMRQVYLFNKTPEEVTKAYQWLMGLKLIWNTGNPLEELTVSLFSKDIESFEEVLRSFHFDEINALDNELLIALKTSALDLRSVIGQSLQLERFLMHIMYTLGEKTEAVLIGRERAEELSRKGSLNLDEQSHVYEYIRCLNRLQKHDEAYFICKQVAGASKGIYATLFLIEMGISRGSKEYEKALSAFQRAVDSTSGQSGNEWLKAKAFASFEMARIYDWRREFPKAIEFYESAKELFYSIKSPRYVLVISLNISWIYLKIMNWKQFEVSQKQLFSIAGEQCNNYVLAGAHLIQSIYHRYFLEPGKSVHHAQLCRRNLNDKAPLEAQFDLLDIEFSTYFLIGSRDLAKKSLEQMKNLVGEESPLRLQQRLKSFELRFSSVELNVEDFEQKWRESWGDEEVAHNQLFEFLQLGIYRVSETAEEDLKKYPLGQLRLIEFDLVKSMQETEDEFTWSLLADFESILHGTSEAMAEKVALNILQFHLQGESNRDFLDNAKLELIRWGCDEQVKRPLKAWIEGAERNCDPRDLSIWKKSAIGDRHRWSGWFNKFFKAKTEEFSMTTNEGSHFSSAPLIIDQGVTLRTDFNELYLDGNLHNAFLKRHHLRKIIGELMKAYPNALEKEALASLVWGEEYDPIIHDARIYTSVQRIRKHLGDSDYVQSLESGYRWDPRKPFCLVKSESQNTALLKRTQKLILQELENRKRRGEIWVSRSQIQQVTQCSDATLKRELSYLLGQNRIQRQGRGRAIVYSV